MANSDKDIVITPNRGQSAEPKIEYRGASSTLGPQIITAYVYPYLGGTLSFEGNAGQIFSLTNSQNGSLYTVNDVSGIPSIELLDTGLLKFAQYGGNVLIGTSADSGGRLRVAGPAFISQLSVGGFSTSFDFYNNGTSYFNGAVTIDDNLTISSGFNIDAPRFRDSSDTNYFADPAGESRFAQIATDAGTSIFLGNKNVTTSSRIIINWHTDADLNYFIGKRAGAWQQPLDIAFYTGIRYHASSAYNGHIFYSGAGVDVTETFSVGKGDSNVRVNNTLYVSGHAYGSYSSSNIALNTSTAGGAGILLRDSGNGFRLQLYGEGTNYGFLDGPWAAWDLRKTIDTALYFNNDSSYYLNPVALTNLNLLHATGQRLHHTFGTSYTYDTQAHYYWNKIAQLSGDGYIQVEILTKSDSNYVPFVYAIASFAAWNSSTFSIKLDVLNSYDIDLKICFDNSNNCWVRSTAIWNSYIKWRIIHEQGATIYNSGIVTQEAQPSGVVCEPGQEARGTQGAASSTSAATASNHLISGLQARREVLAPVFKDSNDTNFFLNPDASGGVSLYARGEIKFQANNGVVTHFNYQNGGNTNYIRGETYIQPDGMTAGTPTFGWPAYNAEIDATSARKVFIETRTGNNSNSTAASGPTVSLIMGQYYDSRVVISAAGSGGASPSDQGTGYGKDLMLKAGTSDNGVGYRGGRLYLSGGMGYTATGYNGNLGHMIMQPFGGNVGIRTATPIASLDVRSSATNDIAVNVAGVNGQLFSVSDSMSGTIFAVNDTSGIPSIEVFDSGKVQIAEVTGSVLLGTNIDNLSDKLQVFGTVSANVFYDLSDRTYYMDLNNTGTSINMAGSVRATAYNSPAIIAVASGTASTGGAIAIQQETAEGWTAIFADYEPYTEWGIWHDNPNNYLHITAGSSTNNITSFTVPSRSSGNRTAYSKFKFQQGDGVFVAGGEIHAPIFKDSNDTNYYLDPNSNSKLVNLGLGGVVPDVRLSVSGDAHVSSYFYMGGTAGSVGSWGTRMLGNGGTFTLNTNTFTVNNVGYGTTWSIETDSGGTTKFNKSGYPIVNFNNTNTSTYGLIQFSENSVQKTYMGLGGSAQSLGANAAYAQDGFSINHDGAGALTISNRGASKWIRLSTGNEDNLNFHTVNIREQKVGISTNDFSYTTSDNASVIDTLSNNRLFVYGSIQLLNNNDAIVIGRGSASFFRDEEIGFGWGGGWYMTDGDWIRARNNKNVYTTGIIRSDGDMRAPVYYDQDDTSYFINPAGASRVKYIEGSNWASFRGANQAINDWDYSGLTVNPSVSSYSDGSWLMQSNAGDWDRGLLSKRRFRRVEGLTFECEILAYSPATLMFGFAGGDTTSYSYCQTPTNLVYLADGSIYVYENCSGQGTSYSFDYRNAWWRFKVVLKGSGAIYYVHKDGKWNIIMSTSNNDQNNYEWVRVLFSNYYTPNTVVIRDAKVYVDHGFRGITYMHTISGYGVASTAFQAPRFEDSDNTAYYVNPASNSYLGKLSLNNTTGPSDSAFGTAADIPLHIYGTSRTASTFLIESAGAFSTDYNHIVLRRTGTPSFNRFIGMLRFYDNNSSGVGYYSAVYGYNRLTSNDLYLEASGGVDDRVILRSGTSSNIIVGPNYVMHLKAGEYVINAPAALDIDCSQANYFTKTISGDSTFTFSNLPAPAGFTVAYSFTLELTHTSGLVTWPASVKWPGNIVPTLTTGKTHLFMFVTDDGGTRWRGSALTNYDN